MATPTEMLAMTASVNVRFLNSVIGMIGSLARSSTITARPSSTHGAADHQEVVAEPHVELRCRPAMTQISRSETPPR